MKTQINAANPDQINAAGDRERMSDKTIKEDLSWIMSEQRGRRWMLWLLGQTGMDKISWTGNSETFFREGSRNVGLLLKSKIDEVSPDLYILMLQEQLSRSKKNG